MKNILKTVLPLLLLIALLLPRQAAAGNLPELQLAPQTLDFGTVTVGEPSMLQTITFTPMYRLPRSQPGGAGYSGNGEFVIGAIALRGANPADFTLGGTCAAGQSLQIGSSCTVTVRFTPAAPGSRSAELYITETPFWVEGDFLPDNPAAPPRLYTLPETEVFIFHTPQGGLQGAFLPENFEVVESSGNPYWWVKLRFLSPAAGASKMLLSRDSRSRIYRILEAMTPQPVMLGGSGVAAAPSGSSIAIDPADPARLYTAIDGAGVFFSTNKGGSWTAVNGTAPDNLPNLRVKGVTLSSAGLLYAGSYGSGVFTSANGGAAWAACGSTGLGSLKILSLKIDQSGNLFAVTEAGIFMSSDSCATWQDRNSGLL